MMLLANEQLGLFSLMKQKQKKDRAPPKAFVQSPMADSMPVIPVTLSSHPRPQSGRVYRSSSRTVPTGTATSGGPKYDQLSLDSVPITSSPASLSSKSFWSIDM